MRSKKQKHQFKRFQAKGTISAALVQFKQIELDPKNFTYEERKYARYVTDTCKLLLDEWKNMLK